MTTVVISRNNGNIVAFSAKGHAGAAESGKDIYCAAISAILQTAVIGLEDYAKVKLNLTVKDGYLSCAFVNRQDASAAEAKAITETMNLGLLSFIEDNGKYLKLVEEVL